MSGPFDDLIPGNKKAPGGFIYTPPADSLGQQQKTVTLQGDKQRQQIEAQKAPFEIQSAKNAAAKSAIDLKNAQEADAGAYGDPNLTGPARLASVPPDKRGIVELLVNNKLSDLGAFALKSPQIQAYLNTAMAVDPTFDPSLMKPRAQALKDFTGAGKASTAIAAVNRLAANLKELKAVSDQMGGPNVLGIRPLNKLIAGTEQQGEATAVARYDALAPEIARQFDRVMKQVGAPSVTGVKEVEDAILDRTRSQDERNAAFSAMASALHGAIAPLKDQWNSAYGGTKAPPMWISKDAGDFLSSLDPENKDDYGGNDWRGLPGLKGDGSQATPFGGNPPPGGGNTPPGAPPVVGGAPGSLAPKADYSTMVGNKQGATVAQGGTKSVYDPVVAGGLNALIHQGASVDRANAYLTSHGYPALSNDEAQTYGQAVAYAKQPGHEKVNLAAANRTVATTPMEQFAGSPLAAGIAGGAAGATAGLSDLAGRTLLGPEWDANRAALAGTHGRADTIGNLAGGVIGSLVAPELAARYAPGALSGAAKIGAALDSKVPGLANIAGDAAYGGLYGANENPNDPLGGGMAGIVTGGLAGKAGRTATKGLASVLSPEAGAFAPLYQAGGFPTIGQRFGQSGFVGRAINTAEQAMQSMPGLGAMVARARDIPRDAAQLGAFNNALGDLKQFDGLLESPISALPAGTQPGPAAHIFTQQAFDKAYPLARSGMQLVPTEDMLGQAQQFAEKWRPLLNGDQQRQLTDLINSSFLTRLKNGGGALNGEQYQQAMSDIGGAANAWSKTEPLLSQAANEYGSILDNAARASSDPQAAALLDAADRGYAKYAGVIRPAASRVGGDPGEFTMKAFDRAVQTNAPGPNNAQYLRGNALMQDYADAIRPLGDVLSNSGTGERLLTNRLFLGEQGLSGAGVAASPIGAALLAHPGALAPFALYAPGVNKLVTRAIAPNAYRGLPNMITGPLDLAADKLDQIAPFVGRAAIPGALAYYGVAQ